MSLSRWSSEEHGTLAPMQYVEDLLERLETRWQTLVTQFQWPDSSRDVFVDLISRYSEPHRRYHTVSHLEAVLAVIDELSSSVTSTTNAVLAAWFHDAVYDPLAADNEERSSDLADDALMGLGVAREVVNSVCSLVTATKAHDVGAGADAAVLLDADLSILGAGEKYYDRYASGVRFEFGDVPDDLYRSGRMAVLEDFLSRPSIFSTSLAQERFEETARANLRREIAQLRVA